MAVLTELAQRGSNGVAGLVEFDDAGVYVGGPGHGGGVAQVAGYLLDDPDDGVPSGGLAADGSFGHGQAHRGQNGPCQVRKSLAV